MDGKRTRGNDEGGVYPRKNKQGKIIGYRGAYWVQTTKGPMRRYVSGKTKSETQAALAKAEADREGCFVFEIEKLTLAEYLDRWLSGPVRTKDLKAVTYENYQRQSRVHIVPALGHLKLTKLTPDLIQDLYDARIAAGSKPSIDRYMHAVLHSALEHAHKRNLVPQNAASKTVPPKVRPPEIHPPRRRAGQDFLGSSTKGASRSPLRRGRHGRSAHRRASRVETDGY